MPWYDSFDISDAISAGSAVADFFGGKSTNKANVESNNQNIAAQAANQEKGLNALAGSSNFGNTTRNAAGGFDNTQVGGADAATARGQLSYGDINRANNINKTTNGSMAPTFNSLQDAIAFRRPDIDIQKNMFNDLAGKSTADTIRRTGAGNSNFANTNNSNLFDLNQRFNFGENVGGLDLYNKQGVADNALLQQIQQTNSLKAPAPGFTASNVGGTAANVIAQSPPPATIPDLGGAVGASALSNLGSDINKRIANTNAANQRAEDNKNLLETIRLLGNK
jgi:predicted regulator of Ras-like GTPase activity (Roadblock/LC7/MglB family)